MSEFSQVKKTPFVLGKFDGDVASPEAGSDIERLNALASQNNAAAVNQIGAEMRARYLSSKNLHPDVRPIPSTTTEGLPTLTGAEWNGKKR